MSDNQFQLILRALKVSKDARYSEVAALTFFLCDILSNLEHEIEFIWRGKWGIVKPLYIVSRYYGLVILMCVVALSSD
ncbi:hypothetical protein H1R20_g8593, partial [Candolleomyces eurysporus]